MAARGSGVAAPRRPAPRSSMPPLFSLSGQKRSFCELSPAAVRCRSLSAFLPGCKVQPSVASRRLFSFIFAFGQQL